MDITIEIDYRERDAGIAEILNTKKNIIVQEKRLTVGDYLINKHITVERKTTRDFVISIIDGRLFSQASRLKKHAETHLVIIEGTDLFHTGYKIDSQAIKGAIISLSISWQIPLIFSKSRNGTTEILIMSGIQEIRYRCEILKRMGRKPKRILTKKLYLLQGLPGVGPMTAKRILEHFGSVGKAITATEQELACVDGIGKKKAAHIREIVE